MRRQISTWIRQVLVAAAGGDNLRQAWHSVWGNRTDHVTIAEHSQVNDGSPTALHQYAADLLTDDRFTTGGAASGAVGGAGYGGSATPTPSGASSGDGAASHPAFAGTGRAGWRVVECAVDQRYWCAGGSGREPVGRWPQRRQSINKPRRTTTSTELNAGPASGGRPERTLTR
ncbi:hypothetical protein HBB16_05655 [Pseudonocardia sp. MCCB 268]|nr:hypothetical protein [Pseudonocardia cytotoxica]